MRKGSDHSTKLAFEEDLPVCAHVVLFSYVCSACGCVFVCVCVLAVLFFCVCASVCLCGKGRGERDLDKGTVITIDLS